MSDRSEIDWPSCTARTLQRVVSIGSKLNLNGVTLALVSLEIYSTGGGILRFLIDFDLELGELEGLPRPHIQIQDESGRLLPSMFSEAGASGRASSHAEMIAGLPEFGNLQVFVPHVTMWHDTGDETDDVWQGPWMFDVQV